MSAMTLDFDHDLNKFIIRCPLWANDALNGLMSRRWSKPKRGWLVPAVKRNVIFLNKDLRGLGAEFTIEAEAAIADCMASYTKMPIKRPFPSWYKFKTKPRKHQEEAINAVYGLSSIGLFMGMGTGKSKTIIDIACANRMENVYEAVVVVCKLSTRMNFHEQIVLHSPLSMDVHLPETGAAGVKRYKNWLIKKHDFKVLIVGTESLSAGGMYDIVTDFVTRHKCMVVVDEGHMIATPNAERSKRCVELGRKAVATMLTTGTSIKDGPLNLFMEFEFLDPDILGIGDYYAFRNRYAVMGGYREKLPGGGFGQPKEVVGYQNLDELISSIAPYVFQKTKEEALPHLPKKGFERRRVKLTDEQQALISLMRKDKKYQIDGRDVRIQNVLELALRVHQVCGGWTVDKTQVELLDGRLKEVRNPTRVCPPSKNPKLIELESILERMRDRSVIIWAPYMPEIDDILQLIRTVWPRQIVLEMTGRVKEAERDSHKRVFQNGGAWMVGNVSTGGTGLTLTACEYMVYYGNTNKFTDRTQSEDRAHRDGLDHPVTYIDIIAEGTIDETILEAFSERMDLVEYLQKLIREATLRL